MAQATKTTASTGFAATGFGPTPITAASAKRGYAKALNPAFAARVFTLTALGASTAKAQGACGARGQQTAMGITAWAVGIAANGGTSATGAAIVAVMLTNAGVLKALASTKAFGTHLNAGVMPPPAFCQGYVNGLCRPQHGLAK